MPKTRVWNDHVLEHVETLGDKEIRIKPGAYIDMEWDEAVRLVGQYRAIELDGVGQQKPESMKVLRKEQIEPLWTDDQRVGTKTTTAFTCQACGMSCVDEDHLAGHIQNQHATQQVKRGPGRPPKPA